MDPETHRIAVRRTARFFTAGSMASPLERVWILLHGYGQLASEFLTQARALEGERTLLVAPEALSRFYHPEHERVGASWMTREDRLAEIQDYLHYLDLLHDHLFGRIVRSQVHLGVLGYSQGAATAARWGARGKSRLDSLVLWGSPLAPELDDESSMERLRRSRLVLVGGSRDPFLGEKEWEEQRARLRSHSVAFEEVRFEGGHRLDDGALRRLGGGWQA